MASITKTHLRLLSLALFMVAMAIVFKEAAAHESAVNHHVNNDFGDEDVYIGSGPIGYGDQIPCDKKNPGANCRLGKPKPYHRGCEISKGCSTDPHGK
ncbi:hypothetical protein AMTRI_Chr07g24670 [Amborella trichopoda]|uniref:Rapid ALkalinization Factor n=1 Tax=Amborella trichopoda TaxID=13333 RepID=U5DEM3_AMBTC|nr:hypothetical protein AMTR_s00067p00137990 [Amborella trichopoda]